MFGTFGKKRVEEGRPAPVETRRSFAEPKPETSADQRRDPRYSSPLVTVIVDRVEYSVLNYSRGGFIIAGTPRGEANGSLRGTVRVDSTNFAFSAGVVRRDEVANVLACRFIAPSPAMLDAMERIGRNSL